ncbi:MAG: bifunctional pyr operon transcriptional regulator/uracil phosphoribosyltransferase PyrR [Candidatus Marinimicrobia bacterium]|nr:bifunctional pyr operon transcriptional regulator/uracil phosphoribosyltransferase PyrR [Candidatus Neomarinimicrobiota bacterium]MCH7859308.1 bifunctional pyr operon transcriptional regulator/uracil phosphoribosyltransferase PyrR [Candidatus Neomarinimicrobiota bacterium]
MKKVKTKLMDAAAFERTLTRLAHQIMERHQQLDQVAIIGVQTRGEPLGRRIGDLIQKHGHRSIKFGTVDVTFHRDDFRTHLPSPQVGPTQIPFAVDDLHIILVDDVLYTGRTVRAAINSIMDFGRPASIELAVLVDRGHRELPIQADYLGINHPTSINEHIHVHVTEVDGIDEVLLLEYDT